MKPISIWYVFSMILGSLDELFKQKSNWNGNRLMVFGMILRSPFTTYSISGFSVTDRCGPVHVPNFFLDNTFLSRVELEQEPEPISGIRFGFQF